MNRLSFVIVALALGACASGLAQTEAQVAETPSVESGRHLAELNCATCHAIGAAGESRHPMAPPFRTLSRDYPVNALEEAFAEGILVGHPDMPEFRFTPAQIDDLLAYVESVQERRGG
jgi:mono/diheme cytochrome c family protein